MSIARTLESVAVWLDDDGLPVRMIWNGERYRVTDRPTVWTSGLLIGGWRFQGTATDGTSRVFDVRHAGGEGAATRWCLVAVYD